MVTNPLALRYDGEHTAPEVVAKGKDLVAMQIRRIAEENDVPIVKEPPLARALHSTEIGQIIPEELYAAVARVLAFVYRAAARRRVARMSTVRKLLRHTDLLAALSVVMMVTMLIVPLPPALLDLLITLNISAASGGGHDVPRQGARLRGLPQPPAADHHVPPGVHRLILTHADAGGVVFLGQFVGGNVVVGLVIFLILVVIQFVVVTNCAGRCRRWRCRESRWRSTPT